MNVANAITLACFPQRVVIVRLFFFGGVYGRLAAVPLLLLLLIVMDVVDGIVARQRQEESLLGSVLDTAANHAVEIILWGVYACLGWISRVLGIVRGAPVRFEARRWDRKKA